MPISRHTLSRRGVRLFAAYAYTAVCADKHVTQGTARRERLPGKPSQRIKGVRFKRGKGDAVQDLYPVGTVSCRGVKIRPAQYPAWTQ
jgi:hypothetical protein